MIYNIIYDWEIKRSTLRHDWLENNFIRAYRAFILRLNSNNAEEEKIALFFKNDFFQLHDKMKEVSKLYNDYYEIQSSKLFFESHTTNKLQLSNKEVFSKIIENIWKIKYNVDYNHNELMKILDEIESKYIYITSSIKMVDSLNLLLYVHDFKNILTNLESLSIILKSLYIKII